MKSLSAPELDRLAEARPANASRTTTLSDDSERRRLLHQIMASGVAPFIAMPQRRRPNKVLLGSTVVAAGALAAGLVIFSGSAQPHTVTIQGAGQAGGAGGGHKVVIRNAAYVTAQAISAMAVPNDSIRETTDVSGGGSSTAPSNLDKSWVYPLVPIPGQQVRTAGMSTTPSGQRLNASFGTFTEPAQVPQTFEMPNPSCSGGAIGSMTQIDYTTGTWYDDTSWCVPNSLFGPSGSDAFPVGPSGPDQSYTASIPYELAQGDWKILGYPVLDGQATIELSWQHTIEIDSQPLTFSRTLWVNATTYLPVKSVESLPAGGVDGQPPSPDSTDTDTYSYLPPTAANLAHLNVTIPAGFTQTSSSPAG